MKGQSEMSDFFKYKVSVVIPVYNCEEFIEPCIDSLMKQTMPVKDFQVIFVNDGSTDESGRICAEAAKKYDNIVFIDKENGGVSSARNAGIEAAEGKYFVFLDADDTLSADTLLTLYIFFEKHYEETDLVTYKIIPHRDGERLPMHYRYKILDESGIYDLNEGDNCYIAQSTMNICVKNRGRGNNILFDTKLRFHEDQKYIFTTLKDKLTIGYCSEPEYWYLRRPGGATGSISKAYYIFEDTMEMWESFFNLYPENEVPAYLQAFYLHDVSWKSVSDVLLPYHYEEKEFDRAVERIVSLIRRIDDEVIIKRPSMDLFHKHYLLQLKGSKSVTLECGDEEISLLFNGEEIYKSQKITAVFNRLKITNGILKTDAFLKSPVFMYCDEPELYLLRGGKREKLSLSHSECEKYHAGIETAVFWRFKLEINLDETESFELEAVINGKPYKLYYYYGAAVPFSHDKRLRAFFSDGKCFREKNGVFTATKIRTPYGLSLALRVLIYHFFYYLKVNPRILINRWIGLFARKSKKKEWIYLDRYGVYDNAYDQFRHDIKIDDGVKRYYVLNACDWGDIEEKFTPEEREFVVKFGSLKHRMLYFSSEKLITSFSNLSNISPFGAAAFRWYTDLTRHEIIYLQHGLLHASLKNMYAKERCVIDKVVVSSAFEVENFVNNYGYDEADLIKCGMPRYDSFRQGAEKKNRIVFSPSWRGNLIGALVNNSREEKPQVFLDSDFYKGVNEFLNSERLAKLLEKYDLYLDFKNHPIFKCYNGLFEITNDRVCIDGFDTMQDEYRLMITDYSSIVFDSVYMNCPIIYFVPDYDQFCAGVSHGYRKLDLPLEKGFGPFTRTADELLDSLEEYAANNFEPVEPYKGRMENFFLHKDTDCRARLYEAIS